MSEIPRPDTIDATQAVSEGVNLFSVDFFKKIVKEHSGNLVCSPLSANIVLSMANTGAWGKTREQFTNVLRLPPSSKSLHGYLNLINILNDVDNVTLKIANKMFVANKFEVKSNFKQDLQTYYRSDIEPVDFNNPEEAADNINQWVKDRTNDCIDKLVDPGDLDPLTRLILASAIYFKGKWAYQFDARNTENRPFYIDESTTKNVPTMYKKSYLKYADLPDYDAKCIELPYANRKISMVIILPNQINGLSRIIENMNGVLGKCIESLNAGYEREVKLYLPKFKTESKLNLEDILKNKMGLSEPFSDSANFSGISSERLKISKVVQKAFIEVSEEGTEAAAVTDRDAKATSLDSTDDRTAFKINHPFHYILIEHFQRDPTNLRKNIKSKSLPECFEPIENLLIMPLFSGTITNPQI